ncbi:hypothetical protein B0H13DRAFT_1851488 [Mycena leptocephala]|nr:hypothetical protein B0H13DRAFT_1851488 [Mycena leptocephala]
MSGNEEAPMPSSPDWVRGTLSCVANCGSTALICALKAVFFAILPLTTLFLALALPILSCIPDNNLAALGVLVLVLYQLAFIFVFDFQFLFTEQKRLIRCICHLDLIYKGVCRDTPLISIGIYLWRNGLLPSNLLSTVHASTRKSFLLKKMEWSDTVGDHGLGTLSSITISVSLLGGASENDAAAEFGVRLTFIAAGPSRPTRNKAGAFFAAVADGAAEPEPPKHKKRKRGKKQDDDMSADDGVYRSEAEQSGDEEEESDDSDLEMVVGGEELAETLTAKTDPKAGKTRSRKTGDSSGKGKAKAVPKKVRKPAAKKSKTQGTSSDSAINVDNSEPETAPADARKASKNRSRPKINPIWRFFQELQSEDVPNAELDKKYYKCNLGNRTIISLTKTSNGNIVPLPHVSSMVDDDSLKPTTEELEIVQGKRDMTPQVAKKYQDGMAKIEGNIVTAMNKRPRNLFNMEPKSNLNNTGPHI